MVNALKGSAHPNSVLLSRTVRDLILYSFPNSTLRIARMPGGLKLGLPVADPSIAPETPTNASSGEGAVAATTEIPEPVFETNSRLQALASQPAQPTIKFSDADVKAALNKVKASKDRNSTRLNSSH